MNYNSSLDDLYELLEVSPRASDEVLRAAHKALLIKYHADRNNNKKTTELLSNINEAYNVLSTESGRLEYDRVRNNLKGEIIGEYRILEKIAEGGFGTTYKAEHILTGKFACIKDCSQIDAFNESILIEEAQAMWDLGHHSIPAAKGMIRMPNRSLGLITKYIPHPTLMKIVEEQTARGLRLDPEHVAWMTERVLNALRYMHYEGVLHGDLKPGNILLDTQKHMGYIVDFGFSKVKPKAGSGNKGTAQFFSAPEIINGEDTSPQSDFYSLGMTMIYALSGDIDWLARKRMPSSTPKPLVEFITNLVKRNPNERPSWPDKSDDPDKPDLWDVFIQVRRDSFGRSRSGLKPIPGFEK